MSFLHNPIHMEMDRSTDRPQIANFMGPTWGPPGSCRPQMGPMLAPWTLLSGTVWWMSMIQKDPQSGKVINTNLWMLTWEHVQLVYSYNTNEPFYDNTLHSTVMKRVRCRQNYVVLSAPLSLHQRWDMGCLLWVFDITDYIISGSPF